MLRLNLPGDQQVAGRAGDLSSSRAESHDRQSGEAARLPLAYCESLAYLEAPSLTLNALPAWPAIPLISIQAPRQLASSPLW